VCVSARHGEQVQFVKWVQCCLHEGQPPGFFEKTKVSKMSKSSQSLANPAKHVRAP